MHLPFKRRLRAEMLNWKTNEFFEKLALPIASLAAIGALINVYKMYYQQIDISTSNVILTVSNLILSTLVFFYRIRAFQRRSHILDLFLKEPVAQSFINDLITMLRRSMAEDGWRIDDMEKGQGCVDPGFNARLVYDPPHIPIHKDNTPWLAYRKYSTDLKKFAIFDALLKSGDLLNDKKIRISSDFINYSNRVLVQQTDYISSVMTDQLAWYRVRSHRLSASGLSPEKVLWDGLSPFIDEDLKTGTARLRGFSEALISNQVGASTLAFSNDGYLMIVAQNKFNLQSVNLLAPSGSGSLDWVDLEKSAAADLLSMVRYGAQRELTEECGLDDAGGKRLPIRSSIIPIGFSRMLHRAGKPEFFFAGKIDAHSEELCNRKRERYVLQVTKADVAPIRFDPKLNFCREVIRICDNYLFKHLTDREGRRIPLSYPLEHGLKLLIETCSHAKAGPVFEEFMTGSF